MSLLDILKNLSTVELYMFISAFLYPMARFVFPHIKSKYINALIHIIYGNILSFALFGIKDSLIMVAFIIISYFLLFLPPWIAGFIGFSMTMATHVYIVLQGVSWALDITGLSMVCFQKVFSLAWNLYDGKRLQEKKEVRKRASQLAVFERPNIFIYYAYLITPYGGFTNPFIEFKVFDYMLNIGNRKEPLTSEDKYLALKRFIEAYLLSGFVAVTMKYMVWENYESQWYLNLNIVLKCFAIAALTAFSVTRYYCSWWVVESGYYAFGLASSNLYDNVKYEISNLSLLEVLDSRSCQDWMRRWNHTTHLFFKNYLYARLMAQGFSSAFGNFAVFFVSMAWHGCRPVYFLLLPESFLIMEADRVFCRKFPAKNIFWILIHDIFVCTTMLYCTSTWFYPWVHNFIYVRKSVYYLPTVFSILMFFALKFVKTPKKPEEIKQKETKAE